MSKTYEMQWDCQFCGTSNLLGVTHRHCPNCGAPQDPDARYYPSDEDKVAVEDHQFVGADQICPACGGLNSGDAEFCGACGSPLTEAAKARKMEQESRAQGAAFDSGGARDVMGEKFERDMAAAGITAQSAEKKGSLVRNIIIGVVLLGVVGFLVTTFVWTQETTVRAVGHEWERTISIEEYAAVSGGDWQEQVPSGAYDETCSQRQRDTEQVQDGETCRTVREDNGDGTFTEREECTPNFRDVPVMDTWCDYTINQWGDGRTVSSSGNSLSDTPYWEDANLNCANQQRLGCEREDNRNESYTVIFDMDGSDVRCSFPEGEWSQIAVESAWTMEQRVVSVGSGAVCNSLEPAG